MVREAHPWRRAAVWLAFLGPLFFISYGTANWVAAQRPNVPSVVFDWERSIPFWSWTIVPYWLIDLLYGLSLFICTTRSELDTHAKRLLTAQLVAVFCFIAFPYRFTFERPAVDGAFGFLFDVLLGFDRPFNQIPSLHIALAVVLWVLYASKVSRAGRLVVDVIFLLICASVLTTYQHHFIDIPTGFALGWLCVWLWPDNVRQRPSFVWSRDPQRLRIAAFYLLGSVTAVVTGTAFGGIGLWLLWPALSLALVALIYAAVGANGFQKGDDGNLTLAARWLLAPYLAGAWINSRWWTRAYAAPSHLADSVWIGRTPTRREMAASPFASLVDLTAELPVAAGKRTLAVFPVLDLTTPSCETLAAAAKAIESLRAEGPVLVCCALGYSRSACAAAAWLLATGRAASVDAALAMIRVARANVVLHADHATALRALVATQ
ncbi:MAG TPA: phosphatase PAP2/dual specificity phosphatase family protein [Casimicrobiaceae bacterium]|jgi:protein-tyrosine phosphatase